MIRQREKAIERMKTEIVSLTAHQLRVPLSAIKWMLKMLLSGDLGRITQKQKGFIEKIYDSNEKMISLITELLDVARIEEGRYIFKTALSDMEKVVLSIISLYKKEIERKKLKFEFEKPEKKLPKIQIDEEKIKLAINNLLDNAIKYTLPGGRVKIGLSYGIKEIGFRIQDSGVGIPKNQQKRVFSKFFRGSNITKTETEGIGLGLFIIKNIIEAHGGKIWFKSKENKGTTFYFTLPIK